MEYSGQVILKNGAAACLRNGTAADGDAVWAVFQQTHAESDYLLSYPDENSFTPAQECEYLANKTASPNEIEIIAEVGGIIVGTAGIEAVGTKEKVRHRAEFGICILRAYWGLGVGRALMDACIECARRAGYAQLELDVVADNTRARAMYERAGFVEYGRNPKGFRSRQSGWQTLVLMRMEL